MISMSEVSIVKSKETPKNYLDVKKMVKRAIDLLGGMKKFIEPNDRVLIKPNLLLPLSPEKAVTTDPRVVQALAEMVREETKAAKIVIGDIPRLKLRSRDVYGPTGIMEAAKNAGVEIAYLDEEEQVDVTVPNAVVLSRTKLPKLVLESDAIIYAAKLKMHPLSVISGAIKSAHGLQITEERAKFHRQDLNHKLVDLLRVVRPTLSVVDAILAMEGQGPVCGDPVEMNTIVVGSDPVAVDTVCSALVGLDPFEVPTTRIAYREGLGERNLQRIIIKGERIENAKKSLKRCDRTIEGVHPKIETFVGGTCSGCMTSSRGFIDILIKKSWIDKLDDGITMITGLDVTLGRKPKNKLVFVLGDCAKNHKDKGIFIPGCIPFDSWTVAIDKVKNYLIKIGKLKEMPMGKEWV